MCERGHLLHVLEHELVALACGLVLLKPVPTRALAKDLRVDVDGLLELQAAREAAKGFIADLVCW